MKDQISIIRENIAYEFRDSGLLEEALTTPGAFNLGERQTKEVKRYGHKRLALMGDALIRLLIIDRWLPTDSSPGMKPEPFDGASTLSTTEQAQIEFLKSGTNQALSLRGHERGLDQHLVKDQSQQGVVPRSTMATSVEAILGAVWVDTRCCLG